MRQSITSYSDYKLLLPERNSKLGYLVTPSKLPSRCSKTDETCLATSPWGVSFGCPWSESQRWYGSTFISWVVLPPEPCEAVFLSVRLHLFVCQSFNLLMQSKEVNNSHGSAERNRKNTRILHMKMCAISLCCYSREESNKRHQTCPGLIHRHQQ